MSGDHRRQVCLNQITLGAQRRPILPTSRDVAAVRKGGRMAIELWLRYWDGIGPAGSW